MTMSSPRVRALLRQARRTAESGKRAAAEQLYRQILDEEPGTVEAWLGLARVSKDEDEREEALRQALVLDPENPTARRLLDGAGLDRRPSSAQRDGPAPADPYSQSRAWLDEATRRPAETHSDEAQSGEGPAPPAVPEEEPAPPAVPEEERAPAATSEEVTGKPPPVEMVTPGDAAVVEDETVLYCYRHPNRATGLRCITCDRPICTRCAQHTPVGYRCPQCIREAQNVFFSAGILDYAVTGVVTLILAIIAGLIAPRLGFFVIFIGPAAGSLIGRIAFRVARRRHGRYLPQLVGALVAIGGLLPALPLLLGGGSLFGLLWPLVYVFLATGAAYYQVK